MENFKFGVAKSSKPVSKRKGVRKTSKLSKTMNATIVYVEGRTCALIEEEEGKEQLIYLLCDASRSIKGLKVIYTGIYCHGHKIMLIDPIREHHSLGRHRYRINTNVQGHLVKDKRFHITKKSHG